MVSIGMVFLQCGENKCVWASRFGPEPAEKSKTSFTRAVVLQAAEAEAELEAVAAETARLRAQLFERR